jgi:hypothetical protein
MPYVCVGSTAVQLLLAGGISQLSKDVDMLAPDTTPSDENGVKVLDLV